MVTFPVIIQSVKIFGVSRSHRLIRVIFEASKNNKLYPEVGL